jgi:hypothetical protein
VPNSSASNAFPPRSMTLISGSLAMPWGIADFIGGFEARRLSVLTVLLLS